MRVPLHIKLVISYLVVVSLALLPTAVYLRTSLHREQIARSRARLGGDLATICTRLVVGVPTDLARRAEFFRYAFPARVTVMTPEGEVLVDSERPEGRLPNHGDRPEVRAAITVGEGSAERVSATTGKRMLYVARRCVSGPSPVAIARLAEHVDELESGRAQIESVLRNAGAVALSVAVLLGLVAALVTVRPLKTIAGAARAIAEGDFGTTLQLRTGDEIEDVALAIDAIVARLRDRLVSTGAEQATTQAIFDELPVGVMVFDGAGEVVRINPAARALCGLEAHLEGVRAAEVLRLPGQRAAMDRARESAQTTQVDLVLPWRAEATLTGRWVRAYANDGGDASALIVIEAGAAAELARARHVLADAAAGLRAAVAVVADADHARAWTDLADRCSPPPRVDPPAAAEIHAVGLRSLVHEASGELGVILAGREVSLAGVGAEEVVVVDAEARARTALRTLLHWLAAREGEIELRVQLEVDTVRLFGKGPVADSDALAALTALLRPLGGDAGLERHDDRDERWVRLSRA